MNAGGLAQMAYSNFPSSNGGLGVPTAGFASRGKANGLKRLSVASPPKVGPISEDHVDNGSTPSRTSRLNMLAGLRTAPKTPSAPTSAPFAQTQHHLGLGSSKYAPQNNLGLGNGIPHTAIGSTFPTNAQKLGLNPGQQFYALPEQVMTPPAIQIDEEDQLDPNYVAQLYAAEQCLNQRALLLQQQLANLALTQRQLQQQYPQSPITPQLSLYHQQLLNGSAPIPQEIPGQPGVYIVYNPLTAQYTYVVDPTTQLANSPPPPTPLQAVSGFSSMDTPTYRADVTSPVDSGSPFGSRSISPPKQSPSPPRDIEPLPPKSANAWRPGHRNKVSSLALSNVSDSVKSSIARPVGMPSTPTTGTFGPGQARAGEHPVRQPRGPPNFEELAAKPTTKHEGSKNFATRTRRKALNSLVRAGLERRVAPRHGSGSAGSMTPVSETELTFSVPTSDNDSDSVRSGSASLSGEPSPGLPPNASQNGAIGCERKASKGSNSMSPTSDDGFEDVKLGGEKQRKTPLLVLANAAEKRKSGMF